MQWRKGLVVWIIILIVILSSSLSKAADYRGGLIMVRPDMSGDDGKVIIYILYVIT